MLFDSRINYSTVNHSAYYKLTHDNTQVTSTIERDSRIVELLPAGHQIDVVDIVLRDDLQLVRGFGRSHGWISLENLDSGHRWAQSIDSDSMSHAEIEQLAAAARDGPPAPQPVSDSGFYPGERVVATTTDICAVREWYRSGDEGTVWRIVSSVDLIVDWERTTNNGRISNIHVGLTPQQAARLQVGEQVVAQYGDSNETRKVGDKGLVAEVLPMQTYVSVLFDRYAQDAVAEIKFAATEGHKLSHLRKLPMAAAGPSHSGTIRTDADGDAVLCDGDVVTGKVYKIADLTYVSPFHYRESRGKVVRGKVDSNGNVQSFIEDVKIPGFPRRQMGEEWEGILSVKYDDGAAQAGKLGCDATSVAKLMLQQVPMAAYYPNVFAKSQHLKSNRKYPNHNKDFSSCNGYDCPFWLEGKGSDVPTVEWCWAGSFFWHEHMCFKCRGPKALLIQIKIGDALGEGQIIEERMAKYLGMRIVKLDCPNKFAPENGKIIAQQLHDAGILIWNGRLDQNTPDGHPTASGHDLKRGPLL